MLIGNLGKLNELERTIKDLQAVTQASGQLDLSNVRSFEKTYQLAIQKETDFLRYKELLRDLAQQMEAERKRIEQETADRVQSYGFP